MKQLLNSNRDVILIVLVGFVLRLSFVSVLHVDGYTSDEKEYIYLASKLAGGGEFVDSNNEWSTKAPLWPYVLSVFFRLFGQGLLIPHLLNCMLGALIIFLGFKLSWELTGDRLTGLVTAGLLALYPGLIIYSDVLQTETLYIVFVLLAFLYLARLQHTPDVYNAVLFGVFAAAATLTRAVYFGFFILMLLIAGWMFRDRFRAYGSKLLIAAAVWALLLMPWTLRNYDVHHAFVPISSWGGISLLLGNNPYSTGTWSSKPGFENWFSTKAAQNGIELSHSTEIERSTLGRKLAIEFISSDPFDATKLVIKKFYMHWIYPITNSDSNRMLQAIAVVGDITLYSLAGMGFIATSQRKTFSPIFAAVGFFTLLQVVMHCEARYRLPIMPLIAVGSAVGGAMALDTRQWKEFYNIRRNRILTSAWMVLLASVYSFTFIQTVLGKI